MYNLVFHLCIIIAIVIGHNYAIQRHYERKGETKAFELYPPERRKAQIPIDFPDRRENKPVFPDYRLT